MTVKQMIKELQQYPEDTEVRMVFWGYDPDGDWGYDACVEPTLDYQKDYQYHTWTENWDKLVKKDLVLIFE